MKIPDNEIQLAIEKFNNGMSITKIAKELNRDRGTLSIRMKKAGANITQHCNKKEIDNTFFDEWNEKSAYWLGFIFADGHLSMDNNFDLCIKDKEHLEKFKTDLKSNHKISKKCVKGNEYYRISFRDKILGSRLKELGVNPNKTYDWKIPDIPKEYIRHFIRGLYDGDGNLNLKKTKGTCSFRIVSYVETVLEDLKNIIQNEIQIEESHIRIYNYSYRVPELNVSSTKAVQSLLDWLYKDSTIYLDRKYNKYLAYCRLGSKL